MNVRGSSTHPIKQVLAGSHGKGFPANLFKVAIRQVAMLQAAHARDDLRALPANRLEALRDDRAGQHSIRTNDQWRICFVWTEAGPMNVEFVDYH